MRKFAILFFATATLLASFTHTANAAPAVYNDTQALRGLKGGKGVFLIDFDNPGKLAFYLDVIHGTYQGMKRQNVTPDFVLVFIGPTVKYLTSKPTETIAFEYEKEMKAIHTNLKRLKSLGVRMEICAVATKVFKVDNQTVFPELDIIGDGFISLIGYQTQGYYLVPIF